MTVQKPISKIPEPPATGPCDLVRQLWRLRTCLHPKASHGTLSTRETPRLEGPWWSHLPWKSLSWFVSWSRGRNLKGRDLRANFRAGHTIPMAGPLWPFSFLRTEMWDCRFFISNCSVNISDPWPQPISAPHPVSHTHTAHHGRGLQVLTPGI